MPLEGACQDQVMKVVLSEESLWKTFIYAVKYIFIYFYQVSF